MDYLNSQIQCSFKPHRTFECFSWQLVNRDFGGRPISYDYNKQITFKIIFGDMAAMFIAGGVAVIAFFITYYFFFINQKNNVESAATT